MTYFVMITISTYNNKVNSNKKVLFETFIIEQLYKTCYN